MHDLFEGNFEEVFLCAGMIECVTYDKLAQPSRVPDFGGTMQVAGLASLSDSNAIQKIKA